MSAEIQKDSAVIRLRATTARRVDRRYSFARARRNRLWLASVIVVDAIIPRTSLRGTFTRVRRASNPLSSISERVRTPIIADRTVATRTRAGLIEMAYSSPESNPARASAIQRKLTGLNAAEL